MPRCGVCSYRTGWKPNNPRGDLDDSGPAHRPQPCGEPPAPPRRALRPRRGRTVAGHPQRTTAAQRGPGFGEGATVRRRARRHGRARSGWRAGGLAAVAQLGSGELLAALLPSARSPVSGLGQALIDFLPGPGVDMVVATAQAKDKALLRAALAASALGSGYLAAGLPDYAVVMVDFGRVGRVK